MKLYLSQKALLCLFLGGFLVGVLSALLYSLSQLLFVYKPRSLFWRIAWHAFGALRDFLLFTGVGTVDAILFFVYHSGRVRAMVFVLNAVGFGIGYYLIVRPILSLLRRWVGRCFRKRSEDVV